MDWTEITDRGKVYFRKYRSILLILLCGVFLMSLPTRQHPEPNVTPSAETEAMTSPELQEQLEQILSQLEGAGKVRVLLTQAEGELLVFQSDETAVTDSSTSNIRRETVTLTDADRAQNGLIRQIIPPTWQGAVVLCQGADSPSVRLAIVEAVSSATGLTSNRITVLKMK